MSKQPPKPAVTVAESEKARHKEGDVYPVGPIRVPFRVPRGNNEYDLIIATFDAPSSVYVARARASRMEVDYELKLFMQRFLGLNRFGPSAPDEQEPLPPHDKVRR